MNTIVQRRLAMAGVPAERIDDLEHRLVLRTSIGFAPRCADHGDSIPVAGRKPQWIHGATRLWGGYPKPT
jgi:hypothetical protein